MQLVLELVLDVVAGGVRLLGVEVGDVVGAAELLAAQTTAVVSFE